MTHNNFTCPYCKGQLAIKAMQIIDKSPSPPWTPLTEYQSVSPSARPGQAGPGPWPGLVGEWQKVTPLGRLSARDVGTTLLDSTIVFGLVSLSLGVICHLSGTTWLVGPCVGLFCSAIRYLYGISHTQGLLTIVETWRSNEATVQPETRPGREPIRVEIKEGKRFQYAYFMADERKLIAFCQALLDGADFTEAEAKKYSITQTELKQFREELINRGLAYWNNPAVHRMGVTLRHSAYTVLEGIIDGTQQQAAAVEEG